MSHSQTKSLLKDAMGDDAEIDYRMNNNRISELIYDH